MQITDARQQRTELRLKLYENGYTPLPNANKACFFEGWSRVTVNPDLIKSKEWARSARSKDTGIRCGDVAAFDFDIDDETILNDLLDILIAEGLLPETPLIRIGRAPREMWIYRMEGDKLAKRTTGGFGWADELAVVKDNLAEGREPGEFRKLQVEVLGAGSQFGAFGQHSDNITYSWPEGSPLDIDIVDIPAVNRGIIEAVVARAEAYFAELKLERIDIGGGTYDGHYTRVYDLTDDMVFTTDELGAATVAEITEYFQSNPGDMLRCTVEALRPSTGGSKAGMMNLVQGMLCVSDHGSYTTHYPANTNPTGKLERIADKLREKLGVPKPSNEPAPKVEATKAEQRNSGFDFDDLELDPGAPFDDMLEVAMRRFAYVQLDDAVVDIYENTPPMSVPHFKNFVAPFFHAETTKQGNEKITSLHEAWIRRPERITVRSVTMRPDKDFPFFEDDEAGVLHANNYRPYQLDGYSGGDASIGLSLIDTLVPNPDERAYFLQWLSYKYQNPHVRGPAIVMVANATFGTGRGSLGALLGQLFSSKYVNSVDFTTLTGKNYQSQYNEWLVGSLIVVVNEAADNDRGASTRWEAKNQAYEHLKTIVDPGFTRMQVTRKGSSNYQGETFASILVMTNHADALVIPHNDRRFYVIENGSNASTEYWDRFHAWRAKPANIAAFAEALCAVDISGYNPFQAPPMTRAKGEMIEAGASELDRTIAEVLAAMPGPLVAFKQVTNAVERYLVENAVVLHDEWQRTAEHVFKRMTRSIPFPRVRLDDHKLHTVRLVPDRTIPPEVASGGESVVEEVLRNGLIVRQLGSSANVVPFRTGQLQGQTNGATTTTDVGDASA